MHKNIRFVYDEPALIVNAGGTEHLVIGDLHIGMEIGLSKERGVHLFGATERMASRIKNIMKDFSLSRVIMLGDVKDSILYPEAPEIKLLKEFFRELDKFKINIIAGNHDAHLDSIIGHEVEKELIVGNFGFTHGNRKLDGRMMGLDYVISAHEHLAVRIRDESGAVYEQKAWAIHGLNKRIAKSAYKEFNESIKLVSIPAFNELIMGTTIEKSAKSRMNPSLACGVFSNRNMEIYNLVGQRIKI